MIFFVLVLGCLFTLLALWANNEEWVRDFLLSIVVFAILFSVNRMNNALGDSITYSRTPVNFMITIAVIAYVIYLFRKRDDRWG